MSITSFGINMDLLATPNVQIKTFLTTRDKLIKLTISIDHIDRCSSIVFENFIKEFKTESQLLDWQRECIDLILNEFKALK